MTRWERIAYWILAVLLILFAVSIIIAADLIRLNP